MKFTCTVDAEHFEDVLHDRIAEYNESHKKKHLHLDVVMYDGSRLLLREGQDHRLFPTEFKGEVKPAAGGVEINGTISSEPKPRVSDYLYLFFVKLLAWLTVSALPYFAVVGILVLFGMKNYLLPLVIPAFLLVCMSISFIRDSFFVRNRIARFMVAYMNCTQTEDIPLLLKRTKRKTGIFTRMRHLVIYHLLYLPVRAYLRLAIGFIPKKPITHKRKFIMIANHTTDFDMLFMSMAVRQQMYFVMSEHALRNGFASRILEWTFAPIGKSKGTNSGSAVMDILRHAKQGYNVGIFAEGYRTMHGVTNSFAPATGAMVKKMGCDMITYRIRGGFLTQPMWGAKLRKGKVTGDIMHVVTAEELEKMTADEVNDLIAQDIFEDYVETQKEEHVPFRAKKGRGLAENIEFVLFACPQCRRIGNIRSSGDSFMCECGHGGRFNEYGELVGEELEFHNVRDWYFWEQDFVKTLGTLPKTEILSVFQGQDLREVDGSQHTDRCVVSNSKTVLTPRGFTVGNYTFLFSDIVYLDAFRRGYMLFTTTDKKYYEVVGEGHYPSLLFKLMWSNRPDNN